MKPQSLSILFGLITVCLFLIGFRLGKYVEHIDKSYIPPTLALLPTKMVVQPTDTILQFAVFTHPCGVSFTYPTSLKKETEASQEAVLQHGSQTISLSCKKISATPSPVEPSSASISGTLKTIAGQKVRLAHTKKGIDSWSIKTPAGKSVTFETSTNLTDLVIKTLEYK